MNYSAIPTASLQPFVTSISLPPISSIDFPTHTTHQPPASIVQSIPPSAPISPPPPLPPSKVPRQLPPLLHYPDTPQYMPQPSDYIHQRTVFSGLQVLSPYQPIPAHASPFSTSDPNLMVAPARPKNKDVKRRTKTGCLTCRKRRIKCDEGRPDCRNCSKSKRHCLGYEPVFQSHQPTPLYSAHTSHPTSNAVHAATYSPRSRRYQIAANSPSPSSHCTTLSTASHSDYPDHSFPRQAELPVPHSYPSHKMEPSGPSGLASYTSASRPSRTIEEICTIAGTKIPSIPAIPPDSVPNLESIRKVYDIAFAPGLDRLLESRHHWFAAEGFNLLAANRTLLGLVLAYLTLVSAHHDAPLNSNDTLGSQEARVTWALLSLCARSVPPTDAEHTSRDREESNTLARRFHALESLLTGEPLTTPATAAAATAASLSDFVHQDQEETDVEPEPISLPDPPVPEAKGTAFEKQVARRGEEFWKVIETAAVAQAGDRDEMTRAMAQARSLTDGKESRDVVYSTLLLGWGRNGDPSSERELAKRYLVTEAGGRATDLVCAVVAGMALRAFED